VCVCVCVCVCLGAAAVVRLFLYVSGLMAKWMQSAGERGVGGGGGDE